MNKRISCLPGKPRRIPPITAAACPRPSVGVTGHTRETVWRSYQVPWFVIWFSPHKMKTHKKLRKEKKATHIKSSSTGISRVSVCVRIHWDCPGDQWHGLGTSFMHDWRDPGAICTGFLLDSLTLELKTQVSHALGRKQPFLGCADVCGIASTVKCQ